MGDLNLSRPILKLSIANLSKELVAKASGKKVLTKQQIAEFQANASKIATAKRKQIIEKLKSNIMIKYPTVFSPTEPKPLAVGIHRTIATEFNVSLVIAKKFLAKWTSSKTYLYHLQKGGKRFDLAGNEVGEVSENEKNFATEELKKKMKLNPKNPKFAKGKNNKRNNKKDVASKE